jgi:predicted transcriptional regulator
MTSSNILKYVVSQEAVKRYIQEQEGKEIFEYSVFGSPQQKIGDFTQTKLGVF